MAIPTIFDTGIFSIIGLSSEILIGAELYWFEAGTSTPAVTYTDPTLTTANANPVLTDSSGRLPEIWLGEGPFKYVLVGPGGSISTPLVAVDNYQPVANYLDDFIADVASPTGASLVGFLQAGTDAVARTAQDKMRERVTPYDFGAVGDGVADDTVALQRFANYIMSNNTKTPFMIGVFKVTSKISFVGTASAVSVINCQCRINASFTAEDEIILFSGWNFGTLAGSFTIYGGGGSSWSSRKNGVGILISNCARLNSEVIFVQYAKYYGVKNVGTTSLNKFALVSTRFCGSHGATGVNLTVSAATNSGSSGSIGQRTALTVDTVPNYIEPGISMCIIGSGLYFIMATDPVNSTITVYPWIDNTVSFPANLDLLVGGGFYAAGGDASCISIGTLDAIQCGIGIYNRSLYMTSVDNAVLQSNGVGFVLGASLTSGSRGGQCALSYYEGNSFDIVKLTSDDSGYIFGSARVIDYAKCLSFAPRLSTNDFAFSSTVLNGMSLAGLTPSHDFAAGGGTSPITATTTPAPMSFYNISRNSQTLNLTMDKNLNRLFGYGSMFIMAEGTGPNLNPTGTYTFNPPTGGTINGGAVNTPLNVSGMTYPTLFHVRSGDGLAWTVTSCPFAP